MAFGEDRKLWDMTEEDFLTIIDSGTGKLMSDKIIEYLVKKYSIETTYDEPDRWTRPACSIIKLNDRHFRVYWHEGLTEYQEDQFFDDGIEEVELIQYEKTIFVQEWRGVKQ